MAPKTLPMLAYKPAIDKHLRSKISAFHREFSGMPWTKDSLDRITKFAVAGKSVRGSLVVYSYQLFTKQIPKTVYDVACGIELIHSGLLIHDDIMDADTIRRNMPTVHSQYEQYAAAHKGQEVARFGVNQAINLANLCYFLGYSLLSSIDATLISVISRELTYVTLAQMQDVESGHMPHVFSKEDIIALYTHKTARYTFSLPLMLGARLAHAADSVVNQLELLGECMGILYQIRDDELNSSGDPSITGKSVFSDAANKKQTLQSVLNPAALEDYTRGKRVEAHNLIRSLPIAADMRQELTVLVNFCEARTH